MKNRVISLVLTLTMIFAMLSVLTVGASAESVRYSEKEQAVAAELAAAVANFEAEYEPSVTVSEDEMLRIFTMARYENPLLFYMNSGYSYYLSSKNGQYCVSKLIFKYTMTPAEYSAARAEVDEWADKIISLADPDFTELEYAVFFHDYLCANYSYDNTLKNHDLYSFIKTGTGVCEAYTAAYTLLLQEVGIGVSFAESDDMNHVWNLVNIDGEWYHVDVTWGDPVGISPGNARHNYFMKSDAAISAMEKPHYNWISNYSCDSAIYDNADFGNVNSPYVYADGNWYYVYNYDLYVTSTPGTAGKVYLDLNMKWFVWDKAGYYYTSFYGGMVADDDYLYISSSEDIIRINLDTGAYNTVYEYTNGDGYIYGFDMDLGDDGVEFADYSSGIARVRIATEPGEELKLIEVQLYEPEPELPEVRPGDVDGDGEILTTDVSLLARYLAGAAVDVTAGADVNGDGDATTSDLSELRRVIA